MGVGAGAGIPGAKGTGAGAVAASLASASERLTPAPALSTPVPPRTGRGGATSAIWTYTGRQRETFARDGSPSINENPDTRHMRISQRGAVFSNMPFSCTPPLTVA